MGYRTNKNDRLYQESTHFYFCRSKRAWKNIVSGLIEKNIKFDSIIIFSLILSKSKTCIFKSWVQNDGKTWLVESENSSLNGLIFHLNCMQVKMSCLSSSISYHWDTRPKPCWCGTLKKERSNLTITDEENDVLTNDELVVAKDFLKQWNNPVSTSKLNIYNGSRCYVWCLQKAWMANSDQLSPSKGSKETWNSLEKSWEIYEQIKRKPLVQSGTWRCYQADESTTNDVGNGESKLSVNHIYIYTTRPALSVCVFVYRGAGRYGITIVPEETKFPEMKRQILLWLLQMLLFAWALHWALK